MLLSGGDIMSAPAAGIPEIDDDPIIRLLWSGEAADLHEAEQLYLDRSLPEMLRLIGSDLSNEALAAHPLFLLLRSHGSWGWEDSLL
jgi:hypothetical protein